MNARKPRQEQEPTSQPASLPGTRLLAQAAKRDPTPAFPLDDKVSELRGKVVKGIIALNLPRVVSE